MTRNGWLGALPSVAYLVVLFAIPLLWFIAQSFIGPHGFTLAQYEQIVTTPVYLGVLWITFKIAGLTTIVSLVAGYPLAYYIARASAGRRNSLMIWVLLPFWTSFLVRTFVWLVILGTHGPIEEALRRVGFGQSVQLLYNLTGVTIGMVHALMPFAVLTMVGVMENIDPNLTRAAQTMGAPPAQAFWRVYFPLSLPGVAAAGLLVFLTALGFFITPSLLGGAHQTMISEIIYQDVNKLLDWGAAGAVSVVLLVATLVVFLVYDRLLGAGTLLSNFAGERGASEFRVAPRWSRAFGARVLDALLVVERNVARVAPLPGRPVLRGLAVAAILFLVIPIVLVLPMSLNGASYLALPPESLSGRWYGAYLTSPEWMAATGRSFEIAFLTMLLATLLGTSAAFALVRHRFAGSALVGALILAPMICPRMVLAVAMFYLYAHLGLVGTTLGLVLGHTVLAIPYVVVTVSAALKTYDVRLDQAALVLGANRWRTFRHVTFPIIRAGLISGALFAFITSFDDLNLALFLTGGLFTTLPKKMWDDMLLQVHPTLAVVSTLMVALISFALLAVELTRRRSLGSGLDEA